MFKHWKLILLAIVVVGVLYFLTRPTTEKLTSNPPVANPLPGQGPQAGQGATMSIPPPPAPSPSPSSSGTNLASSSTPTPPSTAAPGTLDPNLVKDQVKENVLQLRRDYEDLKSLDSSGYNKLKTTLQTMDSVIKELESSTA